MLNSSAKQLMSVEPLAALGVVPDLDSADFTFEDDSGRRFKLRIRPVPAGASESGGSLSNRCHCPFSTRKMRFGLRIWLTRKRLMWISAPTKTWRRSPHGFGNTSGGIR